jgi:hypothetical protein
MGQISGINAQSITYIAGVPVASISYVGPISAATLGLGGGGGPDRVFATDAWGDALNACTNGQKAIDKNGPMTLYQQGDFFYYDDEFTSPLNGQDSWWWCQTNNYSYQINTEGGIMTSQNCGGGLVFTVDFWSEASTACTVGQGSINAHGSQTLYENEGYFYTDPLFQNRFNGQGYWFWCQTNNISYAIGGKGETKNTSACTVSTGKTFTNSTDWGEPAKACNDGPGYIEQGGETIVLYHNQGENRMYTNSSFTEVFFGNGFYYWNQTDNQWWLISGEGYVEGTGNCG